MPLWDDKKLSDRMKDQIARWEEIAENLYRPRKHVDSRVIEQKQIEGDAEGDG